MAVMPPAKLEEQLPTDIEEMEDFVNEEDEETFAGVRVLSPIADNAGRLIREEEERCNVVGVVSSNTTTIRSKRGTVRGVRNRVRQGIATFLRDPSKKVCVL